MAVVVRRGIYLDLDKTKLLPGELCITTDTGQCFFCYAPGNVKELATKKDLQEILTESPEAYNALQKLLEDLENNKDELTNILNDILSLKENKLDVTGDSCNNTVTFEEANNDEDIVSGETHAKIFGKILKSFKALRQGKINTTNIVQTDAVNEQTKVPSSAVTYAHGQLISQLQSNITALNNNLGNIRNEQYSLSAGGTLTISHSGSPFTCLVVAQGSEASLWGSYILHGYGPGTTLRNHIITLGAGEGISVSISDNSFIITNLKPNLDVAVNITLLLGSIISVT